MKRYYTSAAFAALLVMLVAASAFADCTVMPPAGAGPTVAETPAAEWTECQLVTLTVSEAWALSGQNYERFSQMVGAAARLSMEKRGVSVPDTVAAGSELGKMIRERAQCDPNQLLYTVVDSSVRDYAALHPQR